MQESRSRPFPLLLMILLAIPSTLAWAQAVNHLSTGAGINLTSLRDRSMSPLIYSGAGLTGQIGFERMKGSRAFFIELGQDRASISSSPGNRSGYLGFGLKNYTLYRGGKGQEGHFLWGWSNNNILASYAHEVYGNFGSRSYYFTSFGPAAAFSYGFRLLRRQFDLWLPVDLQVIGFYLRPSYISSSPEGYLDPGNSDFKAFLQSIKPFFPGPAWNFGFNPELRYGFGSGNAIALGYSFEYLRMKHPEPVAEVKGLWTVQILTRL